MDLSPDEDNFQGRLLHQAALWDNVDLLQELLQTGADVNALDAYSRSALHAAALAERSGCLPVLCKWGAHLDHVSSTDNGGKTALHIAAERGHVDNIRVLLKAGASVDIADANGETALSLAERNSHRHAITTLTDARDACERERVSQHNQLRELVTRGEGHQLKARLTALGPEAGLIVNLTPGGANTLLYVASECGDAVSVSYLLEAGADGRAHPVTKYSPLYIACYRGHLETAQLLLRHFPNAVQQETVEKWLPLHAACIGGHPAIVTLLLEYPYPESMMVTYTDSKNRRYRSAIDVNARDARSQTALFIASTLGNTGVVEALLSHTLPCITDDQSEEETEAAAPQQLVSPTRAGISLGIHAIVTRLTRQASTGSQTASVARARPTCVEAVRGRDSCLAAAVRGGHEPVARLLLAAGADPDGEAAPPHQDYPAGSERESRRRPRPDSALAARAPSASPSTGGRDDDSTLSWSPLALAARGRQTALVGALAERARDPRGAALRECARAGLHAAAERLLAAKACPDPEYKINKTAISEIVFSNRNDQSLTYNALCPTTPVTVNWRELKCQMAKIRMKWLISASLRVNPRLCSEQAACHAITRLDLSNNELRSLPPELFTLLSLRYLNAAQNKLERLPTRSDPFEDEAQSKKSKKNSKRSRPAVYSAPVLQDLYLQDNRLEELPPELFSLPSMVTLDVSNNKLRSLPYEMWEAPRLKDLNASFNHLKDLPCRDESKMDASARSPQITPSDSSPQLSSSTSGGIMSQFSFGSSRSKSSSRSPSIERSVSESTFQDADEDTDLMRQRAGNATSRPARPVLWWPGARSTMPPPPAAPRPLAALCLAHNQFSRVPAALACLAPRLLRLSLAYNSLRTMSYVTSYPTSLRQLDLSHNEITCWPSLPQVDSVCSSETDHPLACYCPHATPPAVPVPRPRRPRGPRDHLLTTVCGARRHLALDSLRTLILANNLLTRIQLTTDDDGYTNDSPSDDVNIDDDEYKSDGGGVKGRLLFPLLSMLDVSGNMLRGIPPAIHALTNLAVLNISGNKDITDLPPQMGLLSRLWNLNTQGCSLQEPLRSMVQSGKYRSMDIVGYLKSVLQEARPYTTCKLMIVGLQGIGKTSLLEALRQESALMHRRKPTEHWAKRMGNKASRRGNMSTVGVDIGLWTCDKQRSQRPPITFRTWDFGGQREYYATHQYFLSKRSIYLVVWKVTDGRKGLAGAIQWLRSIQARAPGSPVIMVATHYDQVLNSNLPENESPESLQRLIRTNIIGAPDADKLGLPRVMDSVEVSCSTKHNIRLLSDIIYTTAYSVKPPGSKEPLLEQRVPATYLALEECVTHLASELKEPVLRHDEFKRMVTQYMQQKNLRMFRDAAELHQATMFLHDNGVLLHYDDATLKELYFLRPQWLCDVLAHVVTVREINPFASQGIMRMEDLPHVFKSSPMLARCDEAHSLGVSLLNKFELALCWDSRLLLVPPLLPTKEPVVAQLPLRSRAWSASRGPRRAWLAPPTAPTAPTSPIAPTTPTVPPLSRSATDSPTLIHESPCAITVIARDSVSPLRRLVFLSYVPCGFWPRLCTRLLADETVPDAAAAAYLVPQEMELDESTSRALELNWSWKLWQTGVQLVCGALTLASLRQLPSQCDDLIPITTAEEPQEVHPYSGIKFRLEQEGVWTDLDPTTSACIEIILPSQVCVARREDGGPISGYQSISLEPNLESLTKILSLFSDHVDLLLEDWYPSLGTRFVHTSEGRSLITRVVPCPACLRELLATPPPPQHHQQHQQDLHFAQAFKRLEMGGGDVPFRRVRLSEESRTSDGDSGVGGESNGSSIVGGGGGGGGTEISRAWSHERCALAACTAGTLTCDLHGQVQPADVAPDTLFLDMEESARARWEEITCSAVVGRGAFGTVLAGTWRGRDVALKTLQPIEGMAGGLTHKSAAAAARLSRWARSATAAAWRAHSGVRCEARVLSALRHAHVAPLLAVCCAPLALLLPLAPRGALHEALLQYRAAARAVGVRALRALLLQAARALEYLHARHVIYRDLKSENVLVWSMPTPEESVAAELSPEPINVHIKLGDYGISRLALPSGTKGFGGTEGFMAPEIMRYNGEEEYNEKVDCFSFGMLLYEIISLRQPFEGHEAVKEAILDGARPTLTPRELEYPTCVLVSMWWCWQARPGARPAAAALVSLCAAPELCACQHAAAVVPAVVLETEATLAGGTATAAAAAPLPGGGGWEVWSAGSEAGRVLTTIATHAHITRHYTLKLNTESGEPVTVTAVCRVDDQMWIGDSAGRVNVYDSTSCALSWSVPLCDSVGGAPAAVSALRPLPALRRVALALACGRLFLVTSSRPEAEGSFVLTELGTATELCCLAAVPRPQGYEVWAGGSGLHTYSVREGGVCDATTLEEAQRVELLADTGREAVLAVYNDPGYCVYLWSARSRRVTAKLDCSKLVPCSETLQSIALDDRLSEKHCKVTSICARSTEIYAGTAWGCVVVAEATTLRPITVFRPYESTVSAIVSLPAPADSETGDMLMTFGTGYRPLLQRFAPNTPLNTTLNLTSGQFVLLWRTGNWLPD